MSDNDGVISGDRLFDVFMDNDMDQLEDTFLAAKRKFLNAKV